MSHKVITIHTFTCDRVLPSEGGTRPAQTCPAELRITDPAGIRDLKDQVLIAGWDFRPAGQFCPDHPEGPA